MMGKWILKLPAQMLIVVVLVYQRLMSPLLPATCRFHPTCSTYFIQAVRKYGALRGTLKGIWRICRCHPFHPGGEDPA